MYVAPKIIENYQDFSIPTFKIILSSVFYPLDVMYAFANPNLNSNLRYNRYFWNIFNICLDAINWTSLF